MFRYVVKVVITYLGDALDRRFETKREDNSRSLE
jgi:hypothetical protein